MPKRIFLLFVLIPVLLLFECSFKEREANKINEADKFILTKKIRPGVIQVKLGFDAITAIESQNGILVIDAGLSNSLTGKYRKIIEKELNWRDFTYLINTHSHPDHIGGNQVFSDAIIVGHENCLKEVSQKNPEKLKASLSKIARRYATELEALDSGSLDWIEVNCQKIRYQHACNDILNDRIPTLPILTFNDTLNLFLGNLQVNMIYFGKAHSESDILIHIPELKLLFTGDLFFTGGKPSISNSKQIDFHRWLIVKQWLDSRSNQIEKLIGGHGEIMEIEDIDSFKELFEENINILNEP